MGITLKFEFRRLFDSNSAKGSANYLQVQRKYELARTILFFALAAGIFMIGFLSTHSKKNLLTIVAVLGVLPASKSLVSYIMFCRYKGCERTLTQRLLDLLSGVQALQHGFDWVFTTYDRNYVILHLVVYKGDIVCLGADSKMDVEGFKKHLETVLKAEGQVDKTILVLFDQDKYVRRLKEIADSFRTEESVHDQEVLSILKEVSL